MYKVLIYIWFGFLIKFKLIKFIGEKISLMYEYKMIMIYSVLCCVLIVLVFY